MIVVPHVAQVTAQRPVDDFTVAPVRRDGLRVDEDRLIPPAVGQFFESKIAGSRRVVFDDLGHVPQEEDPARTVEPVREFLARH